VEDRKDKEKQIVEYLAGHDWYRVNKDLWSHPNALAFGIGCYEAEDAYRLYQDYLKRGT
jgi:hypothetical protein